MTGGPIVVDVVILGGGVTGAATSLALADRGISSVVVDGGSTPRPPAGESLSGAARPLLRHLGLWTRFRGQGHLETPSTASVWGDGVMRERLFVFEPHGPGWVLDRPAFERMLSDQAMRRGGHRVRPARATDIERRADEWVVGLESSDGRASAVRAAFAVDATGSSGWLTRRLGVRRRQEDALEARLRLYDRAEPRGRRSPVVEARPEGWWYTAEVPGAGRVVALFTTPDRVVRERAPGQTTAGAKPTEVSAPSPPGRWRDDQWLQGLSSTTEIARYAGIAGSAPVSSLWTRPVDVSRAERFHGDGWLAVGDAAFSHDPLSAHGITAGLWGGVLAAASAAAWLGGDRRPLARYGAELERAWARDRRIRRAYYALERRWPEAPFWQGRTVVRPARARPPRRAMGSSPYGRG